MVLNKEDGALNLILFGKCKVCSVPKVGCDPRLYIFYLFREIRLDFSCESSVPMGRCGAMTQVK